MLEQRNKFDFTLVNAKGRTPADVASYVRDLSIFLMMIAAGAPVTDQISEAGARVMAGTQLPQPPPDRNVRSRRQFQRR